MLLESSDHLLSIVQSWQRALLLPGQAEIALQGELPPALGAQTSVTPHHNGTVLNFDLPCQPGRAFPDQLLTFCRCPGWWRVPAVSFSSSFVLGDLPSHCWVFHGHPEKVSVLLAFAFCHSLIPGSHTVPAPGTIMAERGICGFIHCFSPPADSSQIL